MNDLPDNPEEHVVTPDHVRSLVPMLATLHASLTQLCAQFGRPRPEVGFLVFVGPMPAWAVATGLPEALEEYRQALGGGDFLVGPASDSRDDSTVWVLDKSAVLYIWRKLIGDDHGILPEPMAGAIYPGEMHVCVCDSANHDVYINKFSVVPDASVN